MIAVAAITLATAVAAQTAEPLAPAPPPPPPSAPIPAGTNAPTNGPTSASASASSSSSEAPDFFGQGNVGYYLEWYGAEYVAVVGVGTLLATGALNGIEPLPASIGPAINLQHPDARLLLDPRLDDQIGKPMLNDIVPAPAVAVGVGVALLADAGLDLAVRDDPHRTHAILLGGAEAVVSAAAVTEAMKLGFGELRPDFRERYLRASCSGVVPKVQGVDCKTLLADGFTVDRAQLIDGMKSFPSEHAATAFAAASFVAMQLGGAYLWNRDTPQWTRPVAGVAVGGLLATAAFVAASRVEDHHHHLEDVAVGAAIGTASGISAYMLHFDLDDHAIWRGVAVTPMPIAGGAGVGVSGPL